MFLNRNMVCFAMPSDFLADYLPEDGELPPDIKDWGEKIVLSREIIKLLKREQRRTGLSPYALLRVQDTIPVGLMETDINGWLDMSGKPVVKVPFLFLHFVLNAYKKQPSVSRRFKSEKRVAIMPDYLDTLERELDRTGFSVEDIFRQNYDFPHGLSAATVRAWQRGDIGSAFPSSMAALLEFLRDVADKSVPKLYEGLSSDLKPICPSVLKKLQRYRDVLGILPGKVFEGAENIPDDLAKSMVSAWLSERTHNAVPGHVKWVLERCKGLVREAVDIEKD